MFQRLAPHPQGDAGLVQGGARLAQPAMAMTDGLGVVQVAAWARTVMEALERALGRRPLLYTFLSFAEAGNCAGLGGYPLWIANPSSTPGKPYTPKNHVERLLQRIRDKHALLDLLLLQQKQPGGNYTDLIAERLRQLL